jgi:peptidyl-prolyl cis-trans isomerase SurA
MRLRSLAVALVLASAPTVRAELLADGVAAQVGGDVVLMSEVEQVVGPLEPQARAQGATDADLARLRSELLDRLIERRIVSQAAKRAELDASILEVNDAIASIAEENKISLEELQASVAKEGLSFDAYRERIRGEIVQMKVMNGMVRSRVRVDESEVRRMYDEKYAKMPDGGGEEVHLRQILVTAGGDTKRTEAQACDRVKVSLAKVRAGTPFEQEASKVSEVNPEQGGDMGWVAMQAIAAAISSVVSALQPGQVSDVVRQGSACSVLQLVERRSFVKKPWEQAREDIRSILLEQKMGEEYQRFIQKMRAQTYIEKKGNYAVAARGPSGFGLPPVGARSEAAEGGGRSAFGE